MFKHGMHFFNGLDEFRSVLLDRSVTFRVSLLKSAGKDVGRRSDAARTGAHD